MGNAQSSPSTTIHPTKSTSTTKSHAETNKKPKPFVGSFFDDQMVTQLPQKKTSKSSNSMSKVTTTSTTSSSSSTNKKSQPFVGSFFDDQMVAPLPSKTVTKPNKNADTTSNHEISSVITNSSKKSTSNSINFSSKINSSHTSIIYPSSINSDLVSEKDFIIVNNKKYWRGNDSQSFILPFGEEEIDRTTNIHYILKAAFNQNYIAPISQSLSSPGTKVLDIGCGPGTWILEMASEFPQSKFYGIDNCPLYPQNIKLSNAFFKQHDAIQGLPFPDNEFDYIHMRLMMYYFTPEELSHLLTEISRVMKPGGYLEIVDTNYMIRNPGPISNKVINTDLKQLVQSSIHTQQQLDSTINHPIFNFLMIVPQLPSISFVSNFIDICQEHVTLPLGDWDTSQLSKLHSHNFEKLISTIQPKDQSTVFPVTKQNILDIFDECERYKSYLDWFACYARKPPLENQHIEQSTLDSIYEFVEGFVDV